MPPAGPGPLQSRSRNGCIRCKAKRMKCDETKPGCKRCQKKNIPCPGYVSNLKWSTKHEYFRDPKKKRCANSPAAPLSASSPPAAITFVQPIEVQSTHSIPSAHSTPSHTQDGSSPESKSCSTPSVDGRNYVDLGFSNPWQDPFSQFLDDTRRGSVESNVDAIDLLDAPELFGDISNDAIPAPSIPDTMGDFVIENPLELAAQQDNFLSDQDLLDVDGCLELGELIKFDTNNSQQTETTEQVQQKADAGLPMQLMHVSSTLCDYFFKEVISLYSCYDSAGNAIRVMSERYWQSSAVLYHTMQSMSAFCLAEDFPGMEATALSERTAALDCLKQGLSQGMPLDDSLLSMLFLGHTASWKQPTDLAVPFYKQVRRIVAQLNKEGYQSKNMPFFTDTIGYWEMLLSFLTDEMLDDEDQSSKSATMGPKSAFGSILPHPISGTSRSSINLLSNVGTLIYKVRKRVREMDVITQADVDFLQQALGAARSLEKALLNYGATDLTRVVDPGDARTPLDHMSKIEEAYRRTALLELYRIFPDLLDRRYRPWHEDDLLRPKPAAKMPTPDERLRWLTELAINILGLLKGIPFESRTRSVQPIILVAVSSELRIPLQEPANVPDGAKPGAEKPRVVSHFAIEVARARNFVSSRLAAYGHVLPLQKIRKIQELTNAIWAELDKGNPTAYWVDVALQNKLWTLMG